MFLIFTFCKRQKLIDVLTHAMPGGDWSCKKRGSLRLLIYDFTVPVKELVLLPED